MKAVPVTSTRPPAAAAEPAEGASKRRPGSTAADPARGAAEGKDTSDKRRRLGQRRLAALPLRPLVGEGGAFGTALVFCTQRQALEILLHAGPPNVAEKQDVQQLLAIPCELLGPDDLLRTAYESLEPSVCELARRLRPDIPIGLRAEALQQVLGRFGAGVYELQGYYCLVSVTVPFGWEDIEASVDVEESQWRREVCSLIDILPTASGRRRPGEEDALTTARWALRELLRISVDGTLCDVDVQLLLRRQSGISFPFELTGSDGQKVFALMLPPHASMELCKDMLLIGPGSAAPVASPPAGVGADGESAPAGLAAGGSAASEALRALAAREAAGQQETDEADDLD